MYGTPTPNSDWLSIPGPFVATFASLQLRVARTGDSGPTYEDLLYVRGQAYGLPARETAAAFDGYSELYCGYIADRPVAAFAATRAIRGRVDCEEFYPGNFVSAFRHKLTSTARYCRIPNPAVGNQVAQLMVGLSLRDQIVEYGARVFVGNTQAHLLNYYSRLGYQIVSGQAFIHPRWQTRSVVLIASDLQKFRGLAPANTELPDPVLREELAQHVRFCNMNGRRFPKHTACACMLAPDAACAFVEVDRPQVAAE